MLNIKINENFRICLSFNILLNFLELITTEDVKPVKTAPADETSVTNDQPTSTTNSETVSRKIDMFTISNAIKTILNKLILFIVCKFKLKT